MRILVTVPWAERLGGAETMLQTVLDGIDEREYELELIFFEPGPWPKELEGAGFRVHVLRSGRLREAHRWLAMVWKLARIFRRRKPDLILNWAPKTQIYGSPAAALVGMTGRVIWWQQMIPMGHWMDGLATALPARAVGCYSQTAALAQERLTPHRKTFVVAPGAPVPHRSSLKPALKLPSGLPVIGIVGRLQPWKGQDRLLRAHALLRERGHELHTLIVGGDAYGLSSDYASSLPAVVSELDLDDQVTMTGQVTDAGPYIERMDILVNASDPEPFGIVLLEAMAREVAVVAVGSGGPAEFIDDGHTGVLARSGDPGELADTIERLLVAPALRTSIAANGHRTFLERFTDTAMRERFFGELERLASARSH